MLTDTGVLLLRACEVSFFVLTLALEGFTGACISCTRHAPRAHAMHPMHMLAPANQATGSMFCCAEGGTHHVCAQ